MIGAEGVDSDTANSQLAEEGAAPISALQLILKQVTYGAIRRLILEEHYLHRKPAIPRVNFVVQYKEMVVGCLSFGQPVARLEDQKTTLELNRFWLSDQCMKNSESRCLAISLRLLKRIMPHIRRIIAYSDEARGHQGIIYKAAGWKMVKISSPDSWERANRKRHNPIVMGTKRKWEIILHSA